MANEIFNTDRFAVEVISAGEFLDPVSEKTYKVQTYTIRLNHVALAAWRAATATDDREDDETFAAWHPGEDRQAYRAAVEKRKTEFDAQIAGALHITETTDSSFSIACVVSEIFAVAYIHRLA